MEQIYDMFDYQNTASKEIKSKYRHFIESEQIPCNRLIIDENQPFRLYNDEELKDLAARIEQSGLIEPISVRSLRDGNYEVLSGRNRARAIMLNGEK